MHQVKEFLDTKLRPPGSHDVKWILGNKIGPVRWYGAPTASAVMEPGPVLTPVLGTRDKIKLLAEQRVVRMRYPKGLGLNRRLRRS
jgi:hypothetical protein